VDARPTMYVMVGLPGALCELHYLAIDPEEQLRRLEARFERDPGSTYEMRHFDLNTFRSQFQIPSQDELTTERIDRPPALVRLTDFPIWRHVGV